MLDYSFAHWIAFVTAAVLLNLSPGPDMAFILGHTIKSGTRAGFSAVFGIWTGACLHVLLAAFGAIYLVWLGIQALRSSGEGGFVKAAGETMHWSRIYRQGVLVSLLNPKVAIFFLAFLPQFVVEGAGPPGCSFPSMAD